jgi:hypothetical protein
MAKSMRNMDFISHLSLMTYIQDEVSMLSHMCAATLSGFTYSQQTYDPLLQQGEVLLTQECFTAGQMKNFQWHTTEKQQFKRKTPVSSLYSVLNT